MEKKRKRASFSLTPTKTLDTIHEENEGKKPSIKQVVEVVVEESTHKKASEDTRPHINIVMPESRDDRADTEVPEEMQDDDSYVRSSPAKHRTISNDDFDDEDALEAVADYSQKEPERSPSDEIEDQDADEDIRVKTKSAPYLRREDEIHHQRSRASEEDEEEPVSRPRYREEVVEEVPPPPRAAREEEYVEDEEEDVPVRRARPVEREDSEEADQPRKRYHEVEDDDEPTERVVRKTREAEDEIQDEEIPHVVVHHKKEETQREKPIEIHTERQSEKRDAESEMQKEAVQELFGKSNQSVMPEITVHKSNSTQGLLIWALTMIAIAIGVGGGLVLFTNRNTSDSPSVVQSVSPTPQPTQIVSSPTPTRPQIDKKAIRIQVQNGGGKVGAGSSMKEFLEDKGYTVVEVGNADSYSYDETEIVVKPSQVDIRDILEEDLTGTYTVGTVESTLPESAKYDARVIVGKN